MRISSNLILRIGPHGCLMVVGVVRQVQVMEIMRLCLAIRDGVVCIGRGHCSDGPIPLHRLPMTKYLFEILFDWDGGHSLIIVF